MTFQEWFTSIRLGLDFGLKGVGVAIVRGSKVLYAQSLLNLGLVDIANRRGHRRSRRTHRMRQRRLRRFRKYCLRNGLPDPVPLSHTSTAPHSDLKEPHAPDSRWQDLLEIRSSLLDGKATAEEFVRFSYDLVRRRGYTYDSLEETVRRALRPKRGKPPSPADVQKNLLEEFRTTQMPASARERIEQILRDGGCGKLLEPGTDLKRTLEEAVARPSDARQPDVKRPREAVRKELEQVCRANPHFAAHEAAIWEIINWQPRPLRIDNRASTMRKCSWCGKNWRPRLLNVAQDKDSSVREGLLLEAIHNLRHKASKEQAANIRPWWHAARAKDIKKKGVSPSDETLQHVLADLKEISRTADRPEVLKTLGQIFKKYQLADIEKEKFADLLRPREKEEGRSQRCRECIKLGASATSPEDYRNIRAMVQANRQEAVSVGRLEQWLDQCVKAIRRTLFYTDPKGKTRSRYGSLSMISLEVPRYDPDEGKSAKQRLESNQLRRAWPFLRQRWHEQKGVCIYCGQRALTLVEETRADGSIRYRLPAGFEEEHIFPRNDQFQGDDRQNNKVIACDICNRSLKERLTPWHWLKKQPEHWHEFEQRVRKSLLPRSTQELLLSQEDRYPDPVALLTRSGQIRKLLPIKLQQLFREVGQELPDQAISFVDGATTQLARREWRTARDSDGNLVANFEPKDRDNPTHHAQDAALSAGIPPHYLRQVGAWLLPDRGVPKPTFAPDWASYETMKKRKPLSIDLTRRRYDWHAQQWDDTIYGRDPIGRFFVRKVISKADPNLLPEGSDWAREALASGASELTAPGGDKKVRALRVYPTDVGPTSMQEELPGSGRWRKTLLARAWVALRQINGQVELRLPDAREARNKPSKAEGWWTLERGNIVWLKKAEERTVGGIPHIWPQGWYRLTKIAGKGDSLTFAPCDQALPYSVSKKDGKEKKEYGDLTLKTNDLRKLRWPSIK